MATECTTLAVLWMTTDLQRLRMNMVVGTDLAQWFATNPTEGM